MTADECGGSGDQVFDREHINLARLAVQAVRPREGCAEGREQVHADAMLFIDQLQQRFSPGRIWMDMVL